MKHLYLSLLFPILVSAQSLPETAVRDMPNPWDMGQNVTKAANREKAPELNTSDIDADYWIAPNPSVDFLNVRTHIRPAGDVAITVYNILGRQLYSFKAFPGDDSTLLHEDTGNWIPGTYLVRIEAEGKVLKTMRFVKR